MNVRNRSSTGHSVKLHARLLKILTGSDLSQRRIPYMCIDSSKQGPTVWLTACCHGDEVGGIVVVQEVFKRIMKNEMLRRGTLHAFPLMNPLGFENASRQITMSKEDLNRSFPGANNGTLAQRLARKIFASIVDTKPVLVIDLHNDWIRSIPYVVIDPAEGTSVNPDSLHQIAMETGLLVVEESHPMEHSLSFSLLSSGITALTMELGESFVVNEANVEVGVLAVFNLLANFKMLSLESHYRNEHSSGVSHVHRYHQTSASTNGIVRFLAQAGDRVREGQPVAKIVNAFGKQRERILAPATGIVLGLSDSSVAYPGAPIMAFGLSTDAPRPT